MVRQFDKSRTVRDKVEGKAHHPEPLEGSNLCMPDESGNYSIIATLFLQRLLQRQSPSPAFGGGWLSSLELGQGFILKDKPCPCTFLTWFT